MAKWTRNDERPVFQPAVRRLTVSVSSLFGRGATAVNGPGEVVVGSLKGFQSGAAGEIYPFITELAATPLLNLV